MAGSDSHPPNVERTSGWRALSQGVLTGAALVGAAFLTGSSVAYYEEALPTTLNPLFAQTMVDRRSQELVFDRLYFRSAITSTLKSRLIESAEKLDDGKKLKLTVKKGVKWHDGEPFKGTDICFTVNAMLDPGTPSLIGKQYSEVLAGCTGDKGTATIEFKRAFHNLEERLSFRVIPAHKFTSTSIAPDDEFGARPVGTGPMKGTRGRSEARFEAYPNAHHAPKIPVLMLAGGGGDPVVQVRTILGGGVQGIIAVPPQRRPEVRASDEVALKSYDLRSWWFAAVNHKKPHLRDKRVRQAIDLTLDRNQLRQFTMGIKPTDPLPACQFISGPFIPSSPYYNRSIEPNETADLNKAKQLMEAAGAKLEHGLWILNGEPINLRIGMHAPLDIEAKDLLNQLGNQLQSGGFKRHVDKVSNTDWTDKAVSGQLDDWDILIGKWSFGVVEDVNPMFETRRGGKGALNIFNYSNPEVDAIVQRFEDARTDTEAQDAYHDLHAFLAEDLPYIFLWKLDTKSAWRNQVRGNTITPYHYFTEFDAWSFSG